MDKRTSRILQPNKSKKDHPEGKSNGKGYRKL